jgi:predicted amino acid dehydrogenase
MIFTATTMSRWQPSLIHLFAAIPVLFAAHRLLRSPPRLSKVPKQSERVLILGASSGVGRSVAHLYAGRGAKVCLVGRRAAKLDEVVKECQDLGPPSDGPDSRIVDVVADFSDVNDMIRVRSKLENGEIFPF